MPVKKNSKNIIQKPVKREPIKKIKKIRKGGDNNFEIINCKPTPNSEICSCEMVYGVQQIHDNYEKIQKIISEITRDSNYFYETILRDSSSNYLFTAKYFFPLYNDFLTNYDKTFMSTIEYPIISQTTGQRTAVKYFENVIKNYINTLYYVQAQIEYLNNLKWYEKRIIKDYTSNAYYLYKFWKDERVNSIKETGFLPKTNNFIRVFKDNQKKSSLNIGYAFLPQIFIFFYNRYYQQLDFIDEQLRTNADPKFLFDLIINYMTPLQEVLFILRYQNNIQDSKDKSHISEKMKTNAFNTYTESVGEPHYIQFITNNEWDIIFNLFEYGLNNIIDNSPETRNDLTLFRGQSTNYVDELKNLDNDSIYDLTDGRANKGVYFIDRFSSCSINFCVSYNFQGESHNSIIYKYEIPCGIKALLVSPFSAFPHEMEILLPCNKNYVCLFNKQNSDQETDNYLENFQEYTYLQDESPTF